MTTGPLADPFHLVTVREAWDETPTLRALRLDLGPLARHHTRPGQLLKLQPDGAAESYFALANAPRADGGAELLLKRGTRSADAIIAAAEPGASLLATAPFGAGFPVEAAGGHDVLLFAAGSGITPVRALLQTLLARPHGRIALYYGQRSERDFAYTAEYAAWRAAGVHLVLCASQPSPSWRGARGYVQTVAQELALHSIGTQNAVAFLCGMESMIEGVRTLLRRFGLPPERMLLNI